jgi:dihydrodipicolinate synthase/N-acetylneuraminate lyase
MTRQLATSGTITAKSFSGGVIASTLAPFAEDGSLLVEDIADPARRLARIEGILGIAVNTTARERETRTEIERLQVVRQTREALGLGQILLACVGPLSEAVTDEVDGCKGAGADAVITFPPHWREGAGAPVFEDHLMQLIDLADGLALPIIVAHGGHEAGQYHEKTGQITALARTSQKVIGVDMGTHDNVLHYDQAYYALKTIDRPLACLPSSEAALFHNLNTGADGVLSCLAYIAPHEVAALYRATKTGRFCEAQALHNRLSPLIGLISGHDRTTREMVLRHIAHRRGLLASNDARGIDRPLDLPLVRRIEQTLQDIALEHINWVG